MPSCDESWPPSASFVLATLIRSFCRPISLSEVLIESVHDGSDHDRCCARRAAGQQCTGARGLIISGQVQPDMWNRSARWRPVGVVRAARERSGCGGGGDRCCRAAPATAGNPRVPATHCCGATADLLSPHDSHPSPAPQACTIYSLPGAKTATAPAGLIVASAGRGS